MEDDREDDVAAMMAKLGARTFNGQSAEMEVSPETTTTARPSRAGRGGVAALVRLLSVVEKGVGVFVDPSDVAGIAPGCRSGIESSIVTSHTGGPVHVLGTPDRVHEYLTAQAEKLARQPGGYLAEAVALAARGQFYAAGKALRDGIEAGEAADGE